MPRMSLGRRAGLHVCPRRHGRREGMRCDGPFGTPGAGRFGHRRPRQFAAPLDVPASTAVEARSERERPRRRSRRRRRRAIPLRPGQDFPVATQNFQNPFDVVKAAGRPRSIRTVTGCPSSLPPLFQEPPSHRRPKFEIRGTVCDHHRRRVQDLRPERLDFASTRRDIG